MSKPPSVFRMTFNGPAEKQFFFTYDEGLRIRMKGDQIFFQVVEAVKGVDVVRAEKRERGGREVTINGEASGQLLDTLIKMGASIGRPFFILHRDDKDGWIRLEHFSTDKTAPPKNWAHVRIWMARHGEVSAFRTDPDDDDEVVAYLGEFATKIRDARKLVSNHFSERRIGRPPKEVGEAERLLAVFEVLAFEVLPSLDPRAYLRPVQDAMTALGELATVINERVAISPRATPVQEVSDKITDLSPEESKENPEIGEPEEPAD